MLNIVVPMAGRGSRFTAAHFSHPKPLIPIMGRPMIAWIIDNIRPRRDHRFIFICLGEHLRAHPEVSQVLQDLCPGCEVRSLNAVTEGAACTVLTVSDLIDSHHPLMIANSDQYVALGISKLRAWPRPPEWRRADPWELLSHAARAGGLEARWAPAHRPRPDPSPLVC